VAYCWDYRNPINIGILYCFSSLAPIQFAEGLTWFLGDKPVVRQILTKEVYLDELSIR
jgi:hypothetical protein